MNIDDLEDKLAKVFIYTNFLTYITLLLLIIAYPFYRFYKCLINFEGRASPKKTKKEERRIGGEKKMSRFFLDTVFLNVIHIPRKVCCVRIDI